MSVFTRTIEGLTLGQIVDYIDHAHEAQSTLPEVDGSNESVFQWARKRLSEKERELLTSALTTQYSEQDRASLRTDSSANNAKYSFNVTFINENGSCRAVVGFDRKNRVVA